MERLKSKTKLLVALVLAVALAMAGVSYALAAPNNSEENAGISTQAESENTSNSNMVWKTNKAYTAMENNRDEISDYLNEISVDTGWMNNSGYRADWQLFTVDNPNIDFYYNTSGTPLYIPANYDIPTMSNALNNLYMIFAESGATHMTYKIYATCGNDLNVVFDDGSELNINAYSTLSLDEATVSTINAEGNCYEMYSYVHNEDTWEIESISTNPESAFLTLQPGDSNSSNETSNVAFDFNFRATGIQATGFSNYKEAFAALNN